MKNLKEYLDNIGITPDDIEKNTNLPSEIVRGLISGDVNIMSIALESALLLSQYLKLPLSDLASYCVLQNHTWEITIDDDWYYLSFLFGGQKTRLQLAPATPTNAQYIKIIAAVEYEVFLDGIIDAKRGQISIYRNQVEIALKKLDASKTVMQLLDNDTLEELLDARCSPQEAAAVILASYEEE